MCWRIQRSLQRLSGEGGCNIKVHYAGKAVREFLSHWEITENCGRISVYRANVNRLRPVKHNNLALSTEM